MRRFTWRKGCALALVLAGMAIVTTLAASWGISALRQKSTPVQTGDYVPRPLPHIAATPLEPANAARIAPAGILGNGKVYDVAYTPGGSSFAIALSSGIGMYDAETLAQRWFVETAAQVSKVLATPDGELLITANPIRFWEAASGKLLREVQVLEAVGMAISPDGRLFAASAGEQIHIWRLGGFEKVQVLEGQTGEATALAFSPDGKILVAGSYGLYGDKNIYVWKVDSGELLQKLPGHSDTVSEVEFAPDGRSFATASLDDTVRVWQVGDCSFPNDSYARLRRKLWAFLSGDILAIDYSPDGKVLAAGSDDGSIRLWNLSIGWVTATLSGDSSKVTGLDFSPDGKRMVAGHRSHWLYGGRGKVDIWQTDGGLQVGKLATEGDVISHVSFSPDGSLLAATGQWDGSVRLWRVADGALLRVLNTDKEQEGMEAGNFSPDGRLFACVGAGALQLWGVADGALLASQKGLGPAHSVIFSPVPLAEGFLLAAGTGDKISLWAVRDERLEARRTLEGRGGLVQSVAFSADGSLLAAVTSDHRLQVWHVTEGVLLQILLIDSRRDSKTLAFSGDSSRLAVGVGSEIWVWEWQTGELVQQMKGHTSTIYTIVYNPAGTLLASASWDHSVRLWNASDGTALKVLAGHSDYANSVAFSPDGTRLASGGYDGVVRLWGILDSAGP